MDPVTVSLKTPPQSPSPILSPTARRYTFTPKPNLKVPRAWERKPSTPFAPRNESQKIWKRYEFQDANTNGTLHGKTTGTRAIKKLRLEGQETTPYTTSWDEELHETRHKQSSNQNQIAINLPSFANPSTVTCNVRSPVLQHEINGLTTLPNTSQNVEDEDAADDMLATRETRSLLVETPNINSQDIHRLNPEDVSTLAPSFGKHTMVEQPGPSKEEFPMEQDIDEQFGEHGNTVSIQAQSLTADKDTTNVEDSWKVGEEEELPITSPAKIDATDKEKTSPNQSVDQAAACQLDAGLEETLENTTPGQQQKVTVTANQTSPFQTRIRNEGDTPNGPNEAHEKTRNDFALQLRDTKLEHDSIVSSESRTESNTISSDKSIQQPQLENSVPESIQEEQMVRLELDATDGVEKENLLPGSPLRHNLPTQAQEPPSKAPGVAQDEDTDYLHAFLTRAKAKKAAREASPQNFDRVPPSPMTRSRAALVPLSTNSPSPRKANKYQLEATFESEVVETNKGDSPCRRSGRTRLPRPQKAPAVMPSTIPVRRSNGTEFVFLQSTDTAQVALATRANTKRNKGEAVLPKMKLKTLTQAQKSPSKSPKPRKGKGVSWKDEPTYFGMQAEEVKEAGEKRDVDEKQRERKTRRLGGANGTPAPKRMMPEVAMEVRTTVPRKRGKARQ